MKVFTITRSLFENDSYSCIREFSTDQEFLSWASAKSNLGKRDWYLPISTDDDGNEILPEGRIDDTVFVVNVPESAYIDDDGVEQTRAAYSYDTYKMVDQWSYTSEVIPDTSALDAVMEARQVAYQAAGLDLMKLVEYISENNTTKIAEYKTLKAAIQAANPKPV